MLVSEVIAEVRKVVQLRPDVTYDAGVKGCQYADGICSDNSVGCLFGQVLSNLGVDVKRFDKYPMPNREGDTYTPAIDRILKNEFVGTGQEIDWCVRVQEHQDNGLCWDDAVKEADSYLELEPIGD